MQLLVFPSGQHSQSGARRKKEEEKKQFHQGKPTTIHLSIWLPTHPSTNPSSIYPSIHLSTHPLCIQQSIQPYSCQSIHILFYLSINPPSIIHSSIHPSTTHMYPLILEKYSEDTERCLLKQGLAVSEQQLRQSGYQVLLHPLPVKRQCRNVLRVSWQRVTGVPEMIQPLQQLEDLNRRHKNRAVTDELPCMVLKIHQNLLKEITAF